MVAVGAEERQARDRVGDILRNLGGVRIVYAFGPYFVSKVSLNDLKTEE